ncbi:MAG: hypothetical protein ABID67_01555 [Candidatus Nealsonbacteria bacterium]
MENNTIPIVSISNMISSLVFLFVAGKIYFSYKRSKDEKIGDLAKFFILTTVFLFLIGAPGLIVNDLKIIGFLFAIFPSFALIALAHLGIIPLKIMYWERAEKFFFKGLIAITFLITAINLFNWGPATVYYRNSFIIWQDTRGILMNNILGTVFGLGILLIIIFFIIQGFKSSESYLRIRAFLIASGLFSFFISTLVNFIFSASSQSYIISQFLAILFVNLAAVLMMMGTYYKSKDYGESNRGN